MKHFHKMHILLLVLKIIIVCSLTCDEVLEFPGASKLSLVELETMQPKDIVLCLAQLGNRPLPNSEAEFIWRSIIKFFGGIVNIPEEVLMLLKWVTIAVTPEDYANITLGSIDVIESFGLNYNLNERQLSAIASRVRKGFAEKEPEDYTMYDLTALRQILCAFNRSEIERIHPSAYKDAAAVIGSLVRCNKDVMSAFAKLAIHENAYGIPEKWSETTIENVGKVIEYLARELAEKQ